MLENPWTKTDLQGMALGTLRTQSLALSLVRLAVKAVAVRVVVVKVAVAKAEARAVEAKAAGKAVEAKAAEEEVEAEGADALDKADLQGLPAFITAH